MIFKMADPEVIQDGCFHDWSWNENDKSHEIVLSGQNLDHVKFHPSWSVGTAAVRGTKALPRACRSYWEISLQQPFYGTSIMFGVGTKRARLHVDSFVNLLGEDSESMGLSHKGLLWHEGTSREYSRPFLDRKSALISILFDGLRGTLTYYKDGESMGVAFWGLDQISADLYPMVASTAAKIEMRLVKTRRSFISLQDRCGALVADMLVSVQQSKCLPIPSVLQEYVESYKT